jgi:hypothetical protein
MDQQDHRGVEAALRLQKGQQTLTPEQQVG